MFGFVQSPFGSLRWYASFAPLPSQKENFAKESFLVSPGYCSRPRTWVFFRSFRSCVEWCLIINTYVVAMTVDLWSVSPTFEQSFRRLWPAFLVAQSLEVSLIIYWSFFNRHRFFHSRSMVKQRKYLKSLPRLRRAGEYWLVDKRDSNKHTS